MQIQPRTQQAFERIDANKDGVSVQELKTLDQDGNNTLSPDEAQQAGIAAEDTGKVNQALSRSAGHDPSEIVFPPRAEATDRADQKNKEFDDIWTRYREVEDHGFSVHNVEQLRNRLGVGDDWSGSPRLKAMVELLETQDIDDSDNLSYLAEIGRRHGKATLEAICNNLVNYHTSGTAAAGVSKNAVLQDALHDVTYPSDIDQGNKGTCGAAAIQMKLALERPQQYVETLTTLAQGRNYTTPGGEAMRPNSTWRGDSGDDRTTSCKIMQNSIMNLGGTGTFWDNTYNSTNDADEEGLGRDEQTFAIEEIFGNDDYENDSLLSSGATLYQYMEDDIARGRSVSVSFDGHAVLAVGIDKSQNPAQVIMNSWGRQYSMSVDQFQRHVEAVRTIDDSGSDDRTTAAGSKVIRGDR